MKERIKFVMEILISLMILSVFISKGIFNMLFMVLIIFSLYKAFKIKNFYKEKVFFFYLGLELIGTVSNGFSSGIKGVGSFMYNEKSLLYILIFVLLNLKLEQYEKIKNWILIGGISSALYSGISYFTPRFLGIKTLNSVYKETHKMPSFQNGIRWARLLQIMVPFSYVNLEWIKKRVYKLSFVFLSSYFIWNIVINGQRAAILSAMLSMFIFSSMYIFSLKKHRIVSVAVIVVFVMSSGVYISNHNKMINERVVSIFDINNNISNKIRVGYWKIGTDILRENNYLGIGSGNVEKEFEKFMDKKSKSYHEKYYKYHEGTAFENNYINLAVENGILYLIYFVVMQFVVLVNLFKAYLHETNKDKKIKIMTIFSLLVGDRVFIFFYPRTDSYVEFLIIFLMFYGFKLFDKKN